MLVWSPSLLLKINPQARWVLPSSNYFTLFTSSSQMGILTNSFYNTGFELKSIWEFGFSCFTPRYRRRRRPISAEDEEEEEQDCNNKAWLLAEPDLSGSDEPDSVHSSFRFSLCSQMELESFAVNRGPSSAAVLMVNLENGFLTDSHSAEVKKFRRFESLERNISPVANSLIRFTYSEIVSATRNFSAGRVLGRGALSCVFKGRVGFRKMAVAIKRLHKEDKESSKAFCRELMIASSLHNPHIVPLLGFCIDADQGLFLVYKNVSGGSLQRVLHERKRRVKGGGAALPWSARYKIALGIAEAIAYLHNGTGRCVVHRDIKPGNILLSSKKRAKLCDFGLALWTPAPSIPFLCKTVKGTIGYLAPEYFQHGKVSDKTDVYAFGVVLLELLTGRKPIESKRGSGEENLVLWAKQQLRQGCAEKLRDPQLEVGKKDSIRVRRMVRAAAACINNEESLRPDMTEILIVLRGEPACGAVSRKRATLLRSCSSVTDCYPHFQQTNSMVKNHFAVAMMGVDSEDDDPLDFQ